MHRFLIYRQLELTLMRSKTFLQKQFSELFDTHFLVEFDAKKVFVTSSIYIMCLIDSRGLGFNVTKAFFVNYLISPKFVLTNGFPKQLIFAKSSINTFNEHNLKRRKNFDPISKYGDVSQNFPSFYQKLPKTEK